ncbi:Putative signal transducing protein [Paenibacillus sophorae]|uniref:DUF2007 domain-containing protein n=1 Tax=Paenibacillus sophorae TaxID=1333845 RepID=A0A1H8N803_9BACL|nr:hypothetical protein [Paenibacillus sophorae]QWU14748.1 DUF2007 domain-containing protein [Paenibacillus sophorae]SEO25563.1 Putative signal transducing protein [Paenibacillus sophorae]
MGFFKGILRLFVESERMLVCNTFDQIIYIRAKSILAAEGIRHRTRISGSTGAADQRANIGGKIPVQYEIFVAEEDEARALKVLR